MKLRLTEFWLATLCWIFAVYQFLDNAFSAREPHGPYIREMTELFAAKGLAYDYQTFHLLPRVSAATAVYLCFIFLNNWVLPKYQPRKNWNIIGMLLIVAYLFVTTVFATYYRSDNYLTYPSFGRSFVNSMPITFKIFLFLAAYEVVKNVLLYYLMGEEKSHTRKRIIIRESIFVSLVWVLGILFFVGTNNGDLGPVWISLVPVGYVVYALNFYWLIPQYPDLRNFAWSYAGKLFAVLVLICFLGAIVLQLFHSGPPPPAIFTLCILVSILAVVISWFVYHQNKDRLLQLYSLKTQLGKSSADLQFLRSQINPHFLFNILNTLYGTAIQESAERTSEGIQKLGDMMRFMLYENNLNTIPVSREVDYLKDYIHLQKLRIARSENIKVEVNISETPCQHSVAPMLLIPFIENAFKHGISLQNRSWINISLSCQHDKLELDVYNSAHPGSEADPENQQKGIGLENVRQRLELLYPQRYELIIRESKIEYFVHLTLNFSN